MSIEARLESLDQQHKQLDTLLEQERLHPSTDEIRLTDLKRRKLAIKDEMAALTSEAMRRPN